MTRLGYDYSHDGCAKLFTNITKFGYKLIFLTARPITQNEMTKEV